MSDEKTKANLRAVPHPFMSFETKTLPLVPANADVKVAELKVLRANDLPTYRQIKAEFKSDLTTRDTRFRLADQVANQLSVEEEEEQRFLKRVEDEVAAKVSIIKTEAHAEGLKKGQEEGKAQAFEIEKVRLAKTLESLALLIKTMVDAQDQLAQNYEKQLIDVAFKIAEVVIHKEVSEKPAVIGATVNAILTRIAKEDEVRILLSVDAYDALDQVKAEITESGRMGRLSFDADQHIKSGACVVESLSGEIASSIDEAITQLRNDITQRKVRESKAVGA